MLLNHSSASSQCGQPWPLKKYTLTSFVFASPASSVVSTSSVVDSSTSSSIFGSFNVIAGLYLIKD